LNIINSFERCSNDSEHVRTRHVLCEPSGPFQLLMSAVLHAILSSNCILLCRLHLLCCIAGCPVGFHETNGHFSARVMWRRGGKLVSYVYCDDKEKGCGVDWPWHFKATAGKWLTVTVYIKVNDIGALVVKCCLLLLCLTITLSCIITW
jgi:hypothetical protein